MSTLVDTPDGTVEFPDGMSTEQIHTALLNHYQGGKIATAPGYNPVYTVPGRRLTVDIGGGEKPTTIDKLGGGPQPEAAPVTPPEVDRSGLAAHVDAAVRGLTKGALGNFDDELTSAINTVLPLDKITNPNIKSVWDAPGNGILEKLKNAYTNNQSVEHDVEKADEDQHPLIHGVSDIAGTALGALMGGKLLASAAPGVASGLERMALSAPLRTAAVTGAAGGAAYGGVAGAGEDEGDRLQGFKTGAGVGAFTGAALGPTIATLGPAVARYAKVLFGKGVTQEATQQLVEKLGQDGFDINSPHGVHALEAELSKYAGKPVSLADVGTATRSRVGVGLRAPSDVQDQSVQKVIARSQGQGQRLAQDVYANVAPRDDVHALEQNLIDNRSAQALPLREAALSEGPALPPQPALPPPTTGTVATQQVAGPPAAVRPSRIVDDPQLQQLARLPMAQKALTKALEQAESERALLTTTGQSIDHLPDQTRGSDLDARTFDYLKRYLDDQVNALYRRGDTNTFSAAEANNVKALRNAIRDRMKAVIPNYAEYLDTYKGSSDLIDALHQGREYDKLDPEQIVAGQADRTQGEQELFKVGAARNILDVIRGTKDTRQPAGRILDSDEARSQLEAVIGKDKLNRLMSAVGNERELSKLSAELSNSPTAQRLAAAADADGSLATSLPVNLANPLNLTGWLARAGLNKVSTARNAAVNEQLLPRALETNPEIIKNVIIPELQRQGKVAQAKALKKQLQARIATRTVGGLIGGPLAPPPQGASK